MRHTTTLLTACVLMVTGPAWAEEPVPAAPVAITVAPAVAPLAPPTITTSATARDRLPNTVADVSVGVDARAPTAAEVQAQLSAASGPLLAALKAARADRVRTQGVSLRPEVEPNPPRGQQGRVVGYAGRLGVVFQVEAERVGALVSEATARGANVIESVSLHPRESEVAAARTRLATEATRTALAEARAVAEATGLKPGLVQSVSVEPAGQPFLRAMPMAVAQAAAPAPMAIEAGDSEVAVSVTVVMTLTVP